MTMIDEKTVGIVYEGSQSQMTFQRIALDAIANNIADDSADLAR